MHRSTMSGRSLIILYQNIANAARDSQNGWSLWKRLPIIIAQHKKLNPDVVCLIEAGRPTVDEAGKTITWQEIIPMYEKETSLKNLCMHRNNETEMSFGIAVFIRPDLKIVSDPIRHVLCDKQFGTIGTEVSIQIAAHVFTFVATHLSPGNADHRIEALDSMLKLSGIDALFGDFNAYPDSNAEEMQLRMINSDKKFTSELSFVAFPHDPIKPHPKITVSVPHHSQPDSITAFTPLDYVVEPIDTPFKLEISRIHPVSGDIIPKDLNPITILKEIIQTDSQFPGTSRSSDHFALMMSVCPIDSN